MLKTHCVTNQRASTQRSACCVLELLRLICFWCSKQVRHRINPHNLTMFLPMVWLCTSGHNHAFRFRLWHRKYLQSRLRMCKLIVNLFDHADILNQARYHESQSLLSIIHETTTSNHILSPSISGWWFGTCFIFHFIYGMSSFPLTNSMIFQDGEIAPATSYMLKDPWKF
jgi:hypothetical protein